MIYPRKLLWTLFLLAASLALGACSGQIPTPLPTSTPSTTPTVTATVQWFPATNTPTSLPVSSSVPTENMLPGIGDRLFADTFDQPDLWNTAISSVASAAVTGNRLLLSISGRGLPPIISLRSEPLLADFYAEATVNVDLCGSLDKYGLVFRASSVEDYYRFALNCNGQMRLERILSGLATPLGSWLSSGDVPTGAPATVKIGVWAVGNEMRFFLNDRFQFTVIDRFLSAGSLGFFAYASGTTPVTVAFTDLAVYSVFYVSPAPSAIPSSTSKP